MSGGIAYVYTFPPYNLIRDRGDAQLQAEVDGIFDDEKASHEDALIQKLENRFKSSFGRKTNPETIELYSLDTGAKFDVKSNTNDMTKIGVFENEEDEVKSLLLEFIRETGSVVAKDILKHWKITRRFFVKVFPIEYQRATAGNAKPITAPVVVPEPAAAEEEKKSAKTVGDIEDMFGAKTVLDKTRGFLKYPRIKGYYRDTKKRINDWSEVYDIPKIRSEVKVQATRCMDCGIPFCQSNSTGCPLGNMIPSFNDLVHKENWKDAVLTLLQTNNFPEFTGRVCPAPCEGSCVLGINSDPVAIKSIELSISEVGFEREYIQNVIRDKMSATTRSGFRVAVVGSGPAGLAAAAQLALAGHSVTVFDRQPLAGGLLQYGIPSMKLQKNVIERRIELMKNVQGIDFRQGVDVGSAEYPVQKVLDEGFDAIALCVGATWPRDLRIPGRAEAKGIHFAMEYLGNGRQGEYRDRHESLTAKGKKVLVIGGGDTGCDCIGTALREGAESVIAFEILPEPPVGRDASNPWPQWPKIFRVDYGHDEVKLRTGSDPRLYQISSKEFVLGEDGQVKGVKANEVEWTQKPDGNWSMSVKEDEKFFEADLVLLAMGFLGPEKYLAEGLSLDLDPRTNVITTCTDASHEWLDEGSRTYFVRDKIFAGGDCRRGQSLVVHAINEGRQTGRAVDLYLRHKKRQSNMKVQVKCSVESELAASGGIILPATTPSSS
jgi:glutamate synthase (NADPH/NADH)